MSVTAKKILEKKFSEKSPYFALKSPVEKIPFIKKSLEIKSYQFETWEQRMFPSKKEAIDIKNTQAMAIFKKQMHKKSFL